MIDRASLHPRRLKESQAMSAFQHRNYRLFFAGQAVSLVGTWMQQVAQAWLVLELTHDPIWLGIVAAAQFIPVIVLGLFAGVAADAFPKRRVLLWVQTSMMILAAILAVLTITGVVQVWMILVLAFLLGIANAVDMPVRQAFSVELVGHDDVSPAVALNATAALPDRNARRVRRIGLGLHFFEGFAERMCRIDAEDRQLLGEER